MFPYFIIGILFKEIVSGDSTLGGIQVLESANLTVACETSSFGLYKWVIRNKNEETNLYVWVNNTFCIDSTTPPFNTTRFYWNCDKNRTHLNLTLLNVTRQMNGQRVECSRIIPKLNTTITDIVIKVIVPVLHVWLGNGFSTEVVVRDDQSTSLTCSTTGFPEPNIVITLSETNCTLTSGNKVNIALISSQYLYNNNTFLAILTITFIPNRNDSNKTLCCAAKNDVDENHGWMFSNGILLNVVYPPTSYPIIKGFHDNDTYFIIRKSATIQHLSCFITGGNPLARLDWNCYDGNQTTSDFENTVTSNITWRSVAMESGTCVCKASHASGWARNVAVTIVLLYAPNQPNCTIGSEHVQLSNNSIKVILSETLSISCTSLSSPTASDDMYVWTLPNSTVVRGQRLVINNIQRNDTLYTLEITNVMTPTLDKVENGTWRQTFSVNVLFPPFSPEIRYHGNTMTTVANSSIAVIKGKTYVLSCTSDANPAAVIKWITQTSGNATLMINAVNDTFPKQICEAFNTMKPTGHPKQNGTGNATLMIRVLYPPSEPICNVGSEHVHSNNITLKVILSGTLDIKCSSSSNPPVNEDMFVWTLPNSTIVRGKRLVVNNIQRNETLHTLEITNSMVPTFGNIENGTWKQTFTVDVLFAPTTPMISYHGNRTFTLANYSIAIVRDRTYVLNCNSEANPPATIRWISQTSQNATLLIQAGNDTFPNQTCEAFNILKPTGYPEQPSYGNATLVASVLFPPDQPRLSFNHYCNYSVDDGSDNHIIKVIVGQRLSINCSARSRPESSYRWNITNSSVFPNYIDIKSIEIGHKGTYKCTANTTMQSSFDDNAFLEESSSDFELHVLEPPAIKEMKNVTVLRNAELNITCPVQAGNPKETNVQWARGYNTIQPNEVLFIKEIAIADEGFYTCSASNNMTPTRCQPVLGAALQRIYVDVQYEANITDFYERWTTKAKTPVVINEAMPLFLICIVTSDPTASINISLYGHSEQREDRKAIVDGNNANYQVDRSSCAYDMGSYQCSAANKHNSYPQEKHLDVFIKCSPRLSPFHEHVHNITKNIGEIATFTFIVIAYPSPNMTDGYAWEKHNADGYWTDLSDVSTIFTSNTTELSFGRQQTQLFIHNIQPVDYGTYRVNICNTEDGQLSETFFLTAKARPFAPVNFRITPVSITAESVTVSWSPGFNGGLEQHFIIVYRKLNSTWEYVTAHKRDSHLIAGLEDGSTYEIKMFASNEIGPSEETSTIVVTTLLKQEQIDSNQGSNVAGAAIGVTLGVVVVIVVAGLVVYRLRGIPSISIVRKRLRTLRIHSTNGISEHSHVYANHVPLKILNGEQICELNRDTAPPPPMPPSLSTEIQFEVNTGEKDIKYSNVRGKETRTFAIYALRQIVAYVKVDPENVYTEFGTIKKFAKYETTTAQRSCNDNKNRYRNMYPYDYNRVKLPTKHGQPDTDYVNASYINGYHRSSKYIAAQGPLENTIEDFWRMILSDNVSVIVMLTNTIEDSKRKCFQYWHENSGRFGNFTIRTTKCQTYANFVVRRLECIPEHSTKTHCVTHFHFITWPDKDVPDTSLAMVQFWNLIRKVETIKATPLLVHCSAGVGRTGTFIALDYLYDQGIAEGKVNVYDAVKALRDQRICMVQTKEQYVYLHECLSETLCPIGRVYRSDEFVDLSTSTEFVKDVKTEFEEISSDMDTHVDREGVYAKVPDGSTQENFGKNFDDSVVPDDKYRPCLNTFVPGHNNYINAVCISTYVNSSMLILTQNPLEKTTVDFMRLIRDHEVSSVVVFGERMAQNVQYWGPLKQHFRSFTVETQSVQHMKHFTLRSLRHTYTGEDDHTDLLHYEFTSWPDESPLCSVEAFLDVWKAVTHGNSSGPIVLQCRDGHTRSGLFAVLWNILEQIRVDGEVAIAQAVRMVRRRRPQVIKDLEQYKFCNDVSEAFIQQINNVVYENL